MYHSNHKVPAGPWAKMATDDDENDHDDDDDDDAGDDDDDVVDDDDGDINLWQILVIFMADIYKYSSIAMVPQ